MYVFSESCMCIHSWRCIHTYTHIHIHTHIYTYICIHTYTHIHRPDNELEHLTIPSSDQHAATVIWLHGAGLHSGMYACVPLVHEVDVSCMCIYTHMYVHIYFHGAGLHSGMYACVRLIHEVDVLCMCIYTHMYTCILSWSWPAFWYVCMCTSRS